jgi:hypothetical protein
LSIASFVAAIIIIVTVFLYFGGLSLPPTHSAAVTLSFGHIKPANGPTAAPQEEALISFSYSFAVVAVSFELSASNDYKR